MRRRKRFGTVKDAVHDTRRQKHPGKPGPTHGHGKPKTIGRVLAKTAASTICPECSTLNVVVQDQEQTQWCWAAVAQAIDQFYHPGSTLTQCQIATKQLSANCCDTPLPNGCNRPSLLEKALCVVKCFDQGPTHPTLPFNDLRNRIKANDPKPICARIGYEDLGGHFVVIKGVLERAQMLLIADPSDGERLVPFSEFLENYQGFGAWSDYYLTDKVNHGNCI
jgi:hypothetical protein